jgi:hypothetical protein
MKNFLIVVFLIYNQLSFAQLPIGKDLKKGKSELQKIMEANNFHYLRQTNGKNYSVLFFKEEVTISIHSNTFENIESLNFSTGNNIILDKIKKIIEFSNWEFAYNESNRFTSETSPVYKIKNYFARYFNNPTNDNDPEGKYLKYQFILFNEK